MHQPFRRLSFTTAAVAVATVLVGCAGLKPDNEYKAEKFKAAQVAQVHIPIGSGAIWTYCNKDCPEPTPKNDAGSKPAPVAKPKATPSPVAVPAPKPQTVAAAVLKPVKTFSADVLFGFDKSALTSAGIAELAIFAADVPAAALVNVAGYTDRLGRPDYNESLSLKRAEAVRDQLSKHKPDLKFSIDGRGSSDPVTKPSTCPDLMPLADLRACLKADRRVTVMVR